MSERDRPLSGQANIRAEGQARVNAIGGNVNGDVNFGDSIETQRQVLVSDINPNLAPRKLERWVDRAQVQAELLERIDEPQTKLIEIVALGGFGKSSLAVWVTEPAQAKGKYVVPVNFAKVPSFNSFGRWVLQEMGFLTQEKIPDDELIDQLVYRLKNKRCLVVMDQMEVIADAEDRGAFESFLLQWQHHGQNSTVLVTTRQQFLSDENVSLQLPGFTPAEGSAFLEKCGVTTTLSDGLLSLSEVCGGHPLLLKLSAGWLEKTAAGQLNEDDFTFFERLFEQNELGDVEAQVERVFNALLDKLPQLLRTLLLQISVYRVPFDLRQAQAMQPDATAVDLAELEAQGFLLEQAVRWQLHPLVKQLVVDALKREGIEDSAHRQAIEYFEAQLEAETTNLQDYLECFHHYCECQDYEAAYDVIDRCYKWLSLTGYYRILVSTYERLTTAWQVSLPGDQNDQEKLSEALNRLGLAYDSLGEYGKAIDFQQQSLEITTRDRQSQGHRSLSRQPGHCVRFTRGVWQSDRLPAAVARD